MISDEVIEHEALRQTALHELRILDSAPEKEFDALVRVASLACGMPICLIGLIDADRQWFKAKIGLPDVSALPRELVFCDHVVASGDLMVVPDALADPRFTQNPLVTGAPHIRFYAGAPLRLSGGHIAGTLCVIDRQPRELSEAQRGALLTLAEATVHALEHRRQENLLQGQYQRLAYVLEAGNAGSWEWNVETGELLLSDQWATMLGKPLDAIQSISFETLRDHLHPDDVAHADDVIARHFQGETDNVEVEIRLRHDDGHWVWVLVRGRVMSWTSRSEPRLMFGTHQEITERKRREELTRRNEAFLERTGRLAGIGGWELDLGTSEVTWSAETCRIHGVPLGHRPSLDEAIAFYAPAARPIIRAAIDKGTADGTPWDLELPFVRANGDPIWVRAVGSVEREGDLPVRLIGAFQDISERVLAYQALQRANERANLATDSGGIGIWEWDLATNEMIWDAWMYRLYGLEPREGRSPYELWSTKVHPDDLPKAERNAANAIAGDGPLEDIEFRIIRPDGRERTMHGSGHLVRDASGLPERFVGSMYDVTEARQLADDLAKQHELLRVTLDSIGDGVITTDADGLISWMNPVAERMTGWLTAEVAGQPIGNAFHVIDEKTGLPADDLVATCGPDAKFFGSDEHTLLISRDGTEFGIEASAAPIQNKDGQGLGVVLVFNDVTAQRRISGEMTYRATHDALTDLLNRAELEVRLQRLLESTHERGEHHAFLFIDLDQFKLINDMCGHGAGDELLRQVAKSLANTVRSRDSLARLGGDEFAIILDHCPLEQATRVAQQICDRMEVFRFQHGDQRFRIGASIGLVSVDSRWMTTAAIMQAADKSCYAAKEAGRNRFHIWFDTDQAMRDRHGEMHWATRIEQALDEERFVLFGQRIACLQESDRGLRAEVLLRMRDVDGALIPPGAFLPAAERFHLISRVDRWVLSQVVQWLQTLPSLEAIEQLSVNFSGQSIGDRAFHRWANDLLTDAGFEICRLLCFEITETATVTNMADAAQFIEGVRFLGVKVALDDFGAGASSFGYLKTLPVDYLKIDGQFIQGLIEHPLDEATVRSFVDVARVIGVKTVAEFVDRPEIMTRVKDMGIDLAQGFLIHRPEPLSELTLDDACVEVMAAE